MNKAEIAYHYMDLAMRFVEIAIFIWRQWPLAM